MRKKFTATLAAAGGASGVGWSSERHATGSKRRPHAGQRIRKAGSPCHMFQQIRGLKGPEHSPRLCSTLACRYRWARVGADSNETTLGQRNRFHRSSDQEIKGVSK